MTETDRRLKSIFCRKPSSSSRYFSRFFSTKKFDRRCLREKIYLMCWMKLMYQIVVLGMTSLVSLL